MLELLERTLSSFDSENSPCIASRFHETRRFEDKLRSDRDDFSDYVKSHDSADRSSA